MPLFCPVMVATRTRVRSEGSRATPQLGHEGVAIRTRVRSEGKSSSRFVQPPAVATRTRVRSEGDKIFLLTAFLHCCNPHKGA